ncbi:hypothetical protein BP5796_05475 [Coleophoma crateriformis]|uniref:Uncharacterized protein n=1 Tax=Coleophoma crateriformis TaxID=565419 RepID=A0A3D8S393_9HELO|nr:hypothetical protein BP5796_05475 [Coleophoma crateriformis]
MAQTFIIARAVLKGTKNDTISQYHSLPVPILYQCGNTNAGQVTPLSILEQLVIQLIMTHPEIAASYSKLKLLPLQRFQQAKNNPEAVYGILVSVLRMLDEVTSGGN